MTPILTWLFTTPDGWAALLGAGTWIWHKVASKKADARRKTIAEYADQAFKVAEMTGLLEKLDGRGKYRVFIKVIVDALRADESRELTAKEYAQLEELAKRKAWITKALVPPPLPPAAR